MAYLMGIDRGSTNVKAAIYDLRGQEICAASTPAEIPSKPHEGWAEQDMCRIWDNTVRSIRAVLQKSGLDPAQIRAVGFSGHGGGLYAVRVDGSPARAGILSLDSRTRLEDLACHHRGEAAESVSKVVPARLLQWLKRNEPEVFAETHAVMAAKDYLRFRMTGELAVSLSDFGMSVLVDPATQQYDERTLARFGIPEAARMLPPIRDAWEVCGAVTPEAAQQTGLCTGTPCVMGGHDCAAASFGCGGTRTGHLTAILGTFSMNMLVGGASPYATGPDGLFGRPDRAVIPDTWLYMNSALTGRGLDWFVHTFCQDEQETARRNGTSVYDELLAQAASAAQRHLVCHPFIIPPAWAGMEHAQMGLYGVNMNTRRADIIRAVLEGLAFSEVQALLPMTKLAPVRVLTLTGGGASNAFWSQIFADTLDLPVCIPNAGDAACRGAALLAGVGTGLIAGFSNIPAPSVQKTYLPQSEQAEATREAFARWQTYFSYMEPLWRAEAGETL